MRRRLILHAGTPKTGSSALQTGFEAARDRLATLGLLYPRTGLLSATEPKHQWLVRTLRDGRDREFAELMARVGDECDERTHTIVLSTEGLYNSWSAFGAPARACLADLARTYDVRWWLWLRDPADFAESYYVQALWNPQNPYRPEWGRDLDVSAFLATPRVAAQFDYRARCVEMEALFGAGSLYAFAYSRTIVRDACELLRVPASAVEEPRVNVTIARELGVRLLREVNRYPLDAREKAGANESVRALVGIAGERSRPFALTLAERDRARALCSMNADEIAALGAESLRRWRSSEA